MADIKANIDFDVSDLRDSLSDIHGGIEDLVNLLSSSHTKFVRNVNEQADAMKGISDAAQSIGKELETEQQKWSSQIREIGKNWKQTVEEMRREGGIKGLVGEALPTEITGAQSSIQKFKSSVLSELPFGGLIGLMVLGGKKDEVTKAMGAEVSRVFQETGEVGTRYMNEIGKSVRSIGVALGTGPESMKGEFLSAAKAFAQGGVEIEDVMKNKFEVPIRESRGTILETSVALDSLFKQGAGTAARQMTDMIKDFNMSASESARTVAALGLQARDSGTSVSAFMGSVMQSSQALRTQRVDITEVAEAQLKFQKILKEQGGPAMTQQFAAGYAERAIGQVTQGLANMGTGLTAVLGERITARGGLGGGAVGGLEAYYAMREGFQGEGQGAGEQGIFVESIKELVSLTREMGGTKEEQRFFLEKQGFGFEGSKAILDLADQIESVGDDEKAISKVIADNQESLNKAFVNREKETSDFQKALLKIQEGIAQLGAGLLSATISGLQTLVELGRLIWAYISGKSDEEKGFIMQEMERGANAATMATDRIMSGVGTIFKGVGMGVDTTLGFGTGGGGTRAEREQAYYKSVGKGEQVGGRYVSRDEAQELREKATRVQKSSAEREFQETLRFFQIRPEMQRMGYGKEGMMVEKAGSTHAELTRAFRQGGREAVAATAERLEAEGRLGTSKFGHKATAKGLAMFAGEAIEHSGRATMDLGDREVQVRVIVEGQKQQKVVER